MPDYPARHRAAGHFYKKELFRKKFLNSRALVYIFK
jgi:hypothetical protein